jgi:hypothetical protein
MHMKHPMRKTSALVAIVMLLSALAAPSHAGDPAGDLKQIEYKYYFRGKYMEAIGALQTYLARMDVGGDMALRASEFLAASHVLSGAPATGKNVFARLIAADPAYPGPDAAVFKPEVVDVYAQARADYAALTITHPVIADADNAPADTSSTVSPATTTPVSSSKPIYKKWWFYAGTAAVLGVVAVAAGGGGGGDAAAAPRGTVSVGVTVH